MSLKLTIVLTLISVLLSATGFAYLISIDDFEEDMRVDASSVVQSNIKDIQSAYLLLDDDTEFEAFLESHVNAFPSVSVITASTDLAIITAVGDYPADGEIPSNWSDPLLTVLEGDLDDEPIFVFDSQLKILSGITPLCPAKECALLVYRLELAEYYNNNLQLIRRQSLIHIAIGIGGIILLVLIIHRRLATRLKMFNHVISQWRAGKKNSRIDLKGNDELSRIANTFDVLIDELQEEETALLESREFNRAMIESASYAIISTDVSGVIKTINSAGTKLVGYEAKELIGRHTPLVLIPHDAIASTALATLPSLHVILPTQPDEALNCIREDTVFVSKYNKRIPVKISLTPLLGPNGRHAGYLCIADDMTDTKQAERELRLAASVYSHSSQAIIIADKNQRIIDSNSKFKELMGGDDQSINLSHANTTLAAKHSDSFFSYIWRQTVKNGQWSGEVWQRNRDGDEFPTIVTMHCINDPKGRIESVIILSQDITEKKLAEQELQKMAYFDSLTHLPNRFLFKDRLEQAIDHASRSDRFVALMFIDLNRFKEVNDNFGHEVGDELLTQVALRIKRVIRKSDTLSRLGGDEFTIILPNLPPTSAYRDASSSARRILSTFDTTFDVSNRKLYINASIGIAIYPHDGLDNSSLSRNADTAMYQAKVKDCSAYEFFDVKMKEQNFRRLEIETQLRRDLKQNNFTVHYQPIVDLKKKRIAGFEALCRWTHPKHSVDPDEFIAIAEEVGIINELGYYVLDQACATLKKLTPTYPNLYMAINVSGQQFKAHGFSSKIISTLDAMDLKPSQLEVEITESVLLEHDTTVTENIHQLAKANISIALDDFGTGYSSLSYLKDHPISTLKIDKSFIQNARNSDTDITIIRAINMIAKNLDIKLIAEGIEEEKDIELMTRENIRFIQGFYYTKALPAEQLLEYIKELKPRS